MNDYEKQFEDFTREIKFDDAPDGAHRDRLEQDLLRALTRRTPRQNRIWRTIMKSKIGKLATAAIIVLAVGLLLSILSSSTPRAYAIDHTFEAMRRISTMHIFLTAMDGTGFEFWIKVDPETGENTHIYWDHSERGQMIVSTPEETYEYDMNKNVVTHRKGRTLKMGIRFGRFLEDILDALIKPNNGSVQIDREFDSSRKKEVLKVLAEAGELKFSVTIDPETNLPLTMNIISCEMHPGQIGKSMDEIHYDVPLPDGIFEFEIPEDATVVEK
jgi:outer membrane lipoprotein-sorting protein